METGVGFVGIGSMGSGMAANLVAAGHRVVVWNRTRERAEGVLGAEVASTPAALARECQVVMICVSDTPDVEEIVGGKDGLLEGLTPGTLLIDHSTISPSATRRLAGLMAETGGGMARCPRLRWARGCGAGHPFDHGRG